MKQAIITKYIGPRTVRGSRIKATCEAGSIIVDYDLARSSVDNHKDAIELLRLKLNWTGSEWYYGWLGEQMVAVRGD